MNSINRDDLERWIDRTSLFHILEELKVICYDKADHLQSMWQDEAMAREWSEAGMRIANLASQTNI